MRRKMPIFLFLAAACMLTGCGSNKRIELTNEQNDMVAEYIAGALLRYDMRYEEKLIYDSFEPIEESTEEPDISPEPQPEETQTPDTNSTPGEPDTTEVSYSSLDDIFSREGVSLSYKKSSFYNSYPENGNDYFVIEPNVSNKLLVVEFELENTSSEKKKIDLSAAGIKYSLTLGGNSYSPLLTALPNDLRYLNTDIEAGKSKTVVVIFEVEKGAELSGGQLLITRDNVTAQITSL